MLCLKHFRGFLLLLDKVRDPQMACKDQQGLALTNLISLVTMVPFHPATLALLGPRCIKVFPARASLMLLLSFECSSPPHLTLCLDSSVQLFLKHHVDNTYPGCHCIFTYVLI